jgi:peptide/nickel transport system permease protein
LILFESSLSFLGFGVRAPDVSWGLMLAEGRSYMQQAWWPITLPGVCIILFVVSLTIVGDAISDKRYRRY